VVEPGLVQKLLFSALQTIGKPTVRSLIEEGEIVEEGYPELWEGMGVVWKGMEEASGDREDEGEQEESGPGHESEIQSPVRIGRVLDVRWIYGLEHEKIYILQRPGIGHRHGINK
jgi:hypothetical protein